MARFRVSRRAQLDLLEIAAFTLEKWGADQMERYLRELDERFGFIADNRGIGKSIDRIAPGFRQFPQGSHVIFYRMVADDDVEIVRVLHKRRMVDDFDLMP